MRNQIIWTFPSRPTASDWTIVIPVASLGVNRVAVQWATDVPSPADPGNGMIVGYNAAQPDQAATWVEQDNSLNLCVPNGTIEAQPVDNFATDANGVLYIITGNTVPLAGMFSMTNTIGHAFRELRLRWDKTGFLTPSPPVTFDLTVIMQKD